MLIIKLKLVLLIVLKLQLLLMTLMLMLQLKHVLEFALMIFMGKNLIIFVFQLVKQLQLFFIIMMLTLHAYKIVLKDILQNQVCKYVHKLAHLHLLILPMK